MRQGDQRRLPVGDIVQIKGEVCPGIFNNVRKAVGCGLGINGQIHSAQPLYAQHHLCKVGRAAGRHRHYAAPPNALPHQPCGAAQGIFAQLRVGKGIAPLVLDCGARSKFFCRRVKQFWQRKDVVLSGRATAPLGQFALFFVQQIIELRGFNACGQLGNHVFNPRHKALNVAVTQVIAAVAHCERKIACAQLLHDKGSKKNGFLGAVALLGLHNGEFWCAGGRIGQKIDKGISKKGKIASFQPARSQLVGRAHMAVKRGILRADGLKQSGKGIVRGHMYQQRRQRHHGPLPAVEHLALAIGHGGEGDNILFAAHE